jgi:subtilisin family serine protease
MPARSTRSTSSLSQRWSPTDRRPRVTRLHLLACTLVALCVMAGGAGVAAAAAPLQGTDAPGAIPGQYIVVLQNTATSAATQRVRSAATSLGATVLQDYGAALKGFAATMPPAALAAVLADSAVTFVEADNYTEDLETQLNPPWGLDRIDQSKRPLDGKYEWYYTGPQWGFGPVVYLFDSGIREHEDFGGGRAGPFYSVFGAAGWFDDCRGHGTHVAGIIGGKTYGVNKNEALMIASYKVMPCSGPGLVSNLIAGINVATADHTAEYPGVANLSIGAVNPSVALDQAVSNSIADGILYVVAAGNNSGASACNRSPQRVAAALVVGATDYYDRVAPYSNQGPCVDVFAPGSNITSTWNTSTTATRALSGTSMAAPHATGLAAIYLEFDREATPAQVAQWIIATSTPGVITGLDKSTHNRLLYTSGRWIGEMK